ncbi:transmembrane protein 126A [Phyllostomus discolor]|uniref:Transmembrane protein 126A n=1 Tax=Phyllostomus discolor TaxID=89673 RepID=A0A834A8M5_9CHIR|nr:transmembrane protein 126A [Phyllostomus discolor]
MENHEPVDTVKEKQIFDIITRKINQLPEAERNLLEYGSTYIGLNAAICGLIANSLFRRVLNVTQARIAAGLPMAVIPFLTAEVSYKSFISLPLNTGKFYVTTTKLCFGICYLYSALLLKMAVCISMVYQTSLCTQQL